MRPFADTWQRPGWTLRHWDGPDELYPLANQDVYDRAGEISAAHAGQLRADVLRYEILYRHGGVYVDADFECLRPIDPLLEGVRCFAAWEVPDTWINNAILGCEPGHPFLGRLIDGLAANVEAHLRFRPNRMTGPQYLTPVWREHGAADQVTIFDKDLFYPYLWDELGRASESFPGSWAVHHWLNARRRAA